MKVARNPPAGSTPVLDIYARVSRLSDDRMHSTQGQVGDCETAVADRGATVGAIHVDPDLSAWNPKVDRPGWEQLMARLESGATGGVAVYDLARFSRRPIDGERLILAAERGLLVIDSEGEYDLMSASGRKAFRDQMNAAAYESDRLSTRVRRGKRLKAMNGEPNASRRAYGFLPALRDGRGEVVRPVNTAVNEPEARVLRRAAALLLEGEPPASVVAALNESAEPAPGGRVWTTQALQRQLTNPRVNGQVIHDGVCVARLTGEPIVDDETWQRLCASYASRRSGRPYHKGYLLTGQVRCGKCGCALNAHRRTDLNPYPDGETRVRYECPGPPRGCRGVKVDMRELDRHVAALVVAIMSDARHAAAIEAAAANAADRRGKLDTQIAEAEHTAGELAARLGRGELSLSRYDAAAGPLDKRLARLRAERDGLPEEPVPPKLAAATREQWWARWRDASTDQRRGLLRLALRGRQLVVMPATSRVPRFDPTRVVVEG